jgi:predicted lipid-binding transport protein (Tim44 family)
MEEFTMSKTLNRLALMTMLASSLAMSVTVVDARPGGSKSSGSRGSQTNVAPPSTSTAPGTAQPMQRSVTQGAPAAAAAPAAGAAAGAAGAAAAAARPSMARNLMMGVGAGLLGAGLFGLLSGSGFFSGLASLAGLFGFLLQIALIGGVIFLVMRLLRSRREAAVATPTPANLDRVQRDAQTAQAPMQRQMMGGMMGGAAAPAQPAIQPLNLTGDDFGAFEKLLGDVQTAYGAENIPALRALLTPEMASYFEGDLSDNEAKGVVNKIANVKLLQGDLSEAWREAGGEYATVAMRYAISDALVDRKTGRTIEGDLVKVGEVTEVWTFVREPGTSLDGWKLSAIQQVA